MYIYDIIHVGGIITLKDLADYRAHWVTPVTTTLQNGDYEVVSPPPPSSGVIVQLILKILDGKIHYQYFHIWNNPEKHYFVNPNI